MGFLWEVPSDKFFKKYFENFWGLGKFFEWALASYVLIFLRHLTLGPEIRLITGVPYLLHKQNFHLFYFWVLNFSNCGEYLNTGFLNQLLLIYFSHLNYRVFGHAFFCHVKYYFYSVSLRIDTLIDITLRRDIDTSRSGSPTPIYFLKF